MGACSLTALTIGTMAYAITTKLLRQAKTETDNIRDQLGNARRENDRECVICMNEVAAPTILLHPGAVHHKACRDCAAQLLRAHPSRCHICREDLFPQFVNHQLNHQPHQPH